MPGSFDGGSTIQFVGVLVALVYLLVAVGGFALIAWGLLRLSERLALSHARRLEDLRHRHLDRREH